MAIVAILFTKTHTQFSAMAVDLVVKDASTIAANAPDSLIQQNSSSFLTTEVYN